MSGTEFNSGIPDKLPALPDVPLKKGEQSESKDGEKVITDVQRKVFEEQKHLPIPSGHLILSRTWRHIESFFSSISQYFVTTFRNIFATSKNEAPPDKIVKNADTAEIVKKKIEKTVRFADPIAQMIPNSNSRGKYVLKEEPPISKKEELASKSDNVSPNPSKEAISSTADKILDNLVPTGIPVKGINACYRNSSNQALFNFPFFRKLIKEPIKPLPGELQKEFEARDKIRKALENLCECLDDKKDPFIIKVAEANLRREIFSSNLHYEFVDANKNRQLDAPTYIDFILGTVLGYQPMESITKTGNHLLTDTNTEVLIDPGAQVLTKVRAISPCIHIEMSSQANPNLQALVNTAFSPILTEENWRDFSSYTNETKLSGEPQDVLVLQLKRGQASALWNIDVAQMDDEAVKNCFGITGDVDTETLKQLRSNIWEETRNAGASIINDPVEIPSDYKLDFSFAYGQEEELNYQIKSFIRLYAQDGRGGHYVSYVNKEGQWYCCNDDLVTPVTEDIARREMALAYVYMLEKELPKK